MINLSNFTIWLENSNQEVSLLRNAISNVHDKQILMVLADYLEENSRKETNFVRAIATGKTNVFTRFIYDKYVSGIIYGLKARMTALQFISYNSSEPVDPLFVANMRKNWDEILQTGGITLDGTKIGRENKFGVNSVVYYPTYDVWSIYVNKKPYLDLMKITPTTNLYWIAFCANLKLNFVI